MILWLSPRKDLSLSSCTRYNVITTKQYNSPAHIQTCFVISDGEPVPVAFGSEQQWAEGREYAMGLKWTKKGLHEEGEFDGVEYEDSQYERVRQRTKKGLQKDGGQDCNTRVGEREREESEGSQRADNKVDEGEHEGEEEVGLADEDGDETGEEVAVVDVEYKGLIDLEEAKRIVMDCSIVIGLHPDQASQSIVEFASRNRKPFACVPCCVYSG